MKLVEVHGSVARKLIREVIISDEVAKRSADKRMNRYFKNDGHLFNYFITNN